MNWTGDGKKLKLWRYAGDREYHWYIPCVYNIAKMVEKLDPKKCRVELIELEIGEEKK